MKKIILFVVFAAVAAPTCAEKIPMAANHYIGAEKAAQITASDYKPGVVTHVVAFKFKPEVTKAQIEKVLSRFLNLRAECVRDGKPYISSISGGYADSMEGADQGKQIGAVIIFKSEGDRNYYVGQPAIDPEQTQFYDPAHLAFKKFVGPLLAAPAVPNGVFVFDFTAKQRPEKSARSFSESGKGK